MAVWVVGPVVGQLADHRQLLRLAAGEHQHVRVAFGPAQTVGQQTGMVLIDQNDHLAGDAVLNVSQEFADRVHFRFVKLLIDNTKYSSYNSI